LGWSQQALALIECRSSPAFPMGWKVLEPTHETTAMNPIVASLLEFNQAFEIPKLESPGLGPDELIELRIKLLTEEVQEYAEAARAGDLVEVLDALADIGYILAGTIINHGMQHIYDDAFNEVHRSNMAKLVDGKVLRRDDGKVLKPEGWQPPQLAQFLPDEQ
jgi:predicted HAD superfamily Cof-like phosphohydrolase